MKNRTTITLLIVLASLGAVGYYMSGNTSDSSSSMDTSDRKFAVQDRESISKILIAHRNGKKMILEKKENSWYANGDNLVHPNFMGNMLDVLAGISISSSIQ